MAKMAGRSSMRALPWLRSLQRFRCMRFRQTIVCVCVFAGLELQVWWLHFGGAVSQGQKEFAETAERKCKGSKPSTLQEQGCSHLIALSGLHWGLSGSCEWGVLRLLKLEATSRTWWRGPEEGPRPTSQQHHDITGEPKGGHLGD